MVPKTAPAAAVLTTNTLSLNFDKSLYDWTTFFIFIIIVVICIPVDDDDDDDENVFDDCSSILLTTRRPYRLNRKERAEFQKRVY